jgi:hypothetical protein
MARLEALVPRPRVNLIRYPRMFAPNSPWRGVIMPGGDEPGQRLERVLRIDIETCPACGGAVEVVASIEDPVVIRKILAHVGQADPGSEAVRLPEPRAPPDRADERAEGGCWTNRRLMLLIHRSRE